ncbi:hypothetical protein EV368DRAFT_64884 [Lentinula lateritia]|nr:hypothetical protein EV368DRAFT_64884 [Lentinula lateritia]
MGTFRMVVMSKYSLRGHILTFIIVSVAQGSALPLGQGLGATSACNNGTFDASLTGNGRINLQHNNAMFNTMSASLEPPAFNTISVMTRLQDGCYIEPVPIGGNHGMLGNRLSSAATSLNPPFLPYAVNPLSTANNVPQVNTNNTMIEHSMVNTTAHADRHTHSAVDQHFMAQELEYMNDMSPPSPIAMSPPTNQKSIVMPKFNWEDVNANSGPSGNGDERFDGGGNTRGGPINTLANTIFGQNNEPTSSTSTSGGAPYETTGSGITEAYPSNTSFYSASGTTTSEAKPTEGKGKKRAAPDDRSNGPEPATKVAKVDKTQYGGPASAAH